MYKSECLFRKRRESTTNYKPEKAVKYYKYIKSISVI